MSTNLENLDAFRAQALEQWVDGRVLRREEVDSLVWFFQHSYADFAENGLELNGFSFREKQGDWLLVLKVVQEGIPYVVFVGSSNPIRCMFKTKTLLRQRSYRLVEDRFR